MIHLAHERVLDASSFGLDLANEDVDTSCEKEVVGDLFSGRERPDRRLRRLEQPPARARECSR